MIAAKNSLLRERLEKSLPADNAFTYYHISTPPTRCLPLYKPSPGKEPQKTYSESHSLTVTITPGVTEVAIFAIELILYTTASLTTLFVSKADSTGYASLLNLPKSASSLLQLITSTFISWLVEYRHRPDRRLVLSLFARAQGQYLFPGSVENSGKHVLDDRGLVKWWCKTLDPIARSYSMEQLEEDNNDGHQRVQSRAYLIVPGQDKHETMAFFPPSARADKPGCKRWANDHPLRQLVTDPLAPPRCLVPHFPDDPKSRFLNELDEEISDMQSSQAQRPASPNKRGAGQWNSVKSLEQFWDMMAFRQECSSGRLVGFIWVVFSPSHLEKVSQNYRTLASPSPSPLSTKRKSTNEDAPSKPAKHTRGELKQKHLAGPIQSRTPRIKSAQSSSRKAAHHPETTAYYHSPINTRGTLVLTQKAYDRVHEVLLRLDFANLDIASASTHKWITEATIIAGLLKKDWGVMIVGMKHLLTIGGSNGSKGGTVNVLLTKRQKNNSSATNIPNTVSLLPKTNDVSSNLIRKKLKPDATLEAKHQSEVEPSVNVLGAGLVRKKPK